MGWRYFATRKHGDGTETPIEWNLPIKGGKPTEAVSAADSIGGTISPEILALKDDDGQPVFKPWQTAIYAEADGHIRAGALLRDLKVRGSQLALDCVGFIGYADGMPYQAILSKVQVDPLDMGRHIFDYLQSKKHGNIGLVLDDTTSPVRVGTKKKDVKFTTGAGEDVDFEAGPYKLNRWTTADLGAEFDKLAQETPFDYRVEHAWSGETITHRLRLGYPKIGTRRHDLRFTAGENIFEVPEIDFNGDDYASDVLVLGSGDGRDMIYGEAHRETGRLRRVAIVTDKTIQSKKRATKAAEREVKLRAGDADITTVVVADHPNAPLGSYRAGDDIFINTGPGWADASMWVRVLQIAYRPETNDAELSVARAEKVAT